MMRKPGWKRSILIPHVLSLQRDFDRAGDNSLSLSVYSIAGVVATLLIELPLRMLIFGGKWSDKLRYWRYCWVSAGKGWSRGWKTTEV